VKVCAPARSCRRAAPGAKRLEALPATRLRATSLHRVAEQAGGRFTQDRTPTCSRARIASYTVLLAQPAASAIASYDGESLAGRGVVEAPEPFVISICMGDSRMATSKERVAKMRARRKKGRLVISVEVDEADLREIAVAGYEDTTSTDREAQSKAVSLFLSDAVNV
jgi:hypothetical protein